MQQSDKAAKQQNYKETREDLGCCLLFVSITLVDCCLGWWCCHGGWEKKKETVYREEEGGLERRKKEV
eukprot:14594405-Ditylum_brightwellii.AAC.1